ncbi:hypothetical protein HPP92_017779 [Vanilla planifolia]|nr:hypothetical protein HPP92_017779 [Vanilla planifolia]
MSFSPPGVSFPSLMEMAMGGTSVFPSVNWRTGLARVAARSLTRCRSVSPPVVLATRPGLQEHDFEAPAEKEKRMEREEAV